MSKKQVREDTISLLIKCDKEDGTVEYLYEKTQRFVKCGLCGLKMLPDIDGMKLLATKKSDKTIGHLLLKAMYVGKAE